MKLIIDIPYEAYYTFKCELGKGNLNALAETVANGTPYEPKGDLISREALKDIAYINKGNFNTVEGIREWIDNAPTVDIWQLRQEATENALKKAEVLYGRPKGEWITVHFTPDELNCPEKSKFDFVKCPFCEMIHQGGHNFCSYCGADMKGGAE